MPGREPAAHMGFRLGADDGCEDCRKCRYDFRQKMQPGQAERLKHQPLYATACPFPTQPPRIAPARASVLPSGRAVRLQLATHGFPHQVMLVDFRQRLVVDRGLERTQALVDG